MPPRATSLVPQRPRIPGWQRPYVRRPDEVQFGLLPGAPLVTGVSTTEVALLAGLDGSLRRDETYRTAADAGVTRRRWRELLSLTVAIGVLQDAAAEPAPVADGSLGATGRVRAVPGLGRPLPTLLVDGGGVLADHVANALGEAGLGRVVTDPTDVHLAVTDPSRHPDVSVAVLVGDPVVDPRRGDVWRRRGVTLLPVALVGPWAMVGPVIDPRRPGPCLWCLERHRSDRDHDWPTVMSQAIVSSAGAGAAALVAAAAGRRDAPSAGLTQLVTGVATLVLGRLLRGDPPPAGVSVEVSLPWPRMDHRRWTTHPLCPGHAAVEARGPSHGLSHGALPEGA